MCFVALRRIIVVELVSKSCFPVFVSIRASAFINFIKLGVGACPSQANRVFVCHLQLRLKCRLVCANKFVVRAKTSAPTMIIFRICFSWVDFPLADCFPQKSEKAHHLMLPSEATDQGGLAEKNTRRRPLRARVLASSLHIAFEIWSVFLWL